MKCVMKTLISFCLAILWAVFVPTMAQARYLDPNTGRFQTMDSYEGNNSDPLSLHKYLYCHADPVNGWDPTGHEDLASINMAGFIQSGWMGLRTGIVVARAYINAHKLISYTLVFGGIAWAGYEKYIAPGMAGFEATDGKWGAINYFAPSSDLTDLLQNQKDASVKSFTMTGHADEESFKIGTDVALVTGSDGAYSMSDRNNQDILPILKRVLAPDAKITLYGCHSADLARKISTVCTTAKVFGFTSYIMGANAYGVNGAVCTFGSRTLYVNGKEVKDGL